ncbi:hypothetical protein ACFVWR_01665 [Leifsonia sp. NPDC058292]|uniref:hypothetical protein n=1 Tax=Leifsonia sp. NPDC058292 TaxID=3346428 RepID=UPI0036D8D357
MVLNHDRRESESESGSGAGGVPDAVGQSPSADAAPTARATEPAAPAAASASSEGAFDPNYDPAFQRGYSPRPGEESRTRLRTVADDSPFRRPAAGAPADQRPPRVPRAPRAPRDDSWAASDAASLDRAEAEAADVAAAAAAVSGAGSALPPELEALGFGASSVPFDDDEDDAAPDGWRPLDRSDTAVVITGASILERAELSPRRNPYFLALWIMGGGFVVLGVLLYAVSVYTSYTSTADSQDVSTLVFSQVGWMLASPLVMVGLATIVALVLLTALRSRTRRHSSEAEGAADRTTAPGAGESY